jgi:hypothetical protein
MSENITKITTDKLQPNGLRIIDGNTYRNLYGGDEATDKENERVTCNSCEWIGYEEDLSFQIPEDEKDQEGITPAGCCPNCGNIGYLANVELVSQ